MPNGEGSLEDRVAGEQGEKKEEKKPSSFEIAGEEISQAFKATRDIGIAAGSFGLAALVSGYDALYSASVIPLARILSKEKAELKDIRDSAIVGAGLGSLVPIIVDTIEQVPAAFGITNSIAAASAVGGLGFLVLNPVLNGVYHILDYAVTNKTLNPVKLYSHLKENYVDSFKRTWKLSAVQSVAMGVTYAVPALAPLLFPALAISSLMFALQLSKNGVDYEKVKNLAIAPFKIPYYLAVRAPYYLVSGAVSLGSKGYDVATSFLFRLGNGINQYANNLSAAAPAPSGAGQEAPAGG